MDTITKHRRPRYHALHDRMARAGYITAQKAADLASVTIFTIYRWAEEGKLVQQRINTHRYVQLDSLLRYLGPETVALLNMVPKPLEPLPAPSAEPALPRAPVGDKA